MALFTEVVLGPMVENKMASLMSARVPRHNSKPVSLSELSSHHHEIPPHPAWTLRLVGAAGSPDAGLMSEEGSVGAESPPALVAIT